MSQDPRTILLLQENLDSEFSWRTQELSNIKNSIPREKGPAQNTMIRAGVALLYAHWEGFIKESVFQYYQFLSYQSHNIVDYKSSLIAILVSSKANELVDGKRISKKQLLMDAIIDELNQKANFPNQHPLKTSNLRYDIFEDACALLNIDVNEFGVSTDNPNGISAEYIDKQLVEKRNNIALGKHLIINYETFNKELFLKVTSTLRKFKDAVLDSAAQKKYLRNP